MDIFTQSSVRTHTLVVLVTLLAAGAATAFQSPRMFAPGTVSIPDSHDDYISLTPDGGQAVFTRLAAGYRGGTVYLADRAASGWGNVRVAPFSGTHQDSRAVFSPDGRRILFASNRPGPGREGRTDLDLWQVERTSTGWSEPVNLGAPVNTTAHESHPSLATSGALYFARRVTEPDIWMAPSSGTRFGDPVMLPNTINTPGADSHVFVDPAERYLLFARIVEGSGDDVFFSARRNGTWTPAVPLGAEINGPHYDYSAKVYGKTVYFTRNGHWTGGGPADIFMVPASAVTLLSPFHR
jgi:hypothetical protein